ncbi:hypothetical protein [Pedobacter sp. L105]|uniref:hypothetical protein n=1 Tax=Pedobacter sp. L105 TaxID=1641871 RepID=UPI00131AA865|nr:hypothetical protein [Pedobacter sp. L105]
MSLKPKKRFGISVIYEKFDILSHELSELYIQRKSELLQMRAMKEFLNQKNEEIIQLKNKLNDLLKEPDSNSTEQSISE